MFYDFKKTRLQMYLVLILYDKGKKSSEVEIKYATNDLIYAEDYVTSRISFIL